ncbi:MAG: hypothetical protein ACR2N9_09205, partial [Acidimicrobiia bacterium]
MKRLGLALVIVIGLMSIATVWLTVAGGFIDVPGSTRGSATHIADALGSVVFAGAGFVIVSHRQRNLVGWLMIGIGAAGAIEGLGSRVVANSCDIGTGRGCLLEIAVLSDTPFYVFLFVVAGLFLLFPHG